MSGRPDRKRCKIGEAVCILEEKPRTVRDMAAAGEIPGAAKIRGTWSFDTAKLHQLVAEKERATCQSALNARPRRAVSGGAARSTAGYKPAAATSNGHYGQTIQRLRQAAAKQNAPAQ